MEGEADFGRGKGKHCATGVWARASGSDTARLRDRTRLPLEKYRPSEAEKSSYEHLDLQDAQSRLWQDPFAAVHQHQEALDKLLNDKAYGQSAMEHFKRHTLDRLQSRITESSKKAALTIIAVAVAGGPYAEDAEQRRRYRYATLSGLNRLGFGPDDGGHIGYVLTRPGFTLPACSESGHLLPERIPFEWLVKIGDQTLPEEALVVWLSEHALSRAPVKSLEALVECLGIRNSERPVSMKVLGPALSHTLTNLIYDGEVFPPNLGRIEVSNPRPRRFRATRIFLFATSPRNGSNSVSSERSRPMSGWRQPSWKSCDSAAHSSVAAVTSRSGETATTSHSSRSGTHRYGQALPRAFDLAVDRYCREATLRTKEANPDGCPGILRASYLQGIDGAGPEGGTSHNGSAATARPNGKNASREASRGERADGRHQFDYLRRLADRLRRANAELKRHGSEITAIGVLGSDVYDKLLVLKALRKEFPGVVFFTTDLDARLLHPDEFKWSRNLVVGASYGLDLRSELQDTIPPFRDSYQTSLFLATLLAFSTDPRKYIAIELHERTPPRVFEIGRRTAFALEGPIADSDTCAQTTLLDCMRLHPNRLPMVSHALIETTLWMPFLIVLLLLGVLRYPNVRRADNTESQVGLPTPPADSAPNGQANCTLRIVQRRLDRRGRRFLFLFMASAVLFSGWLYWGFIPILALNEEPLTFYEGISVWPSELIRAIAGMLGLFLIVWAALRLDVNQVLMTRWFFPKCRDAGMPVVKFSWRDPKDWVRVFECDLLREQHDLGKGIDAELLWREFMFHNLPGPRIICTVIPAALFGVLALWSMHTWGFPTVPARGALSVMVDKAVLLATVPIFLFLTFFVVNTTLLCKRFIGTLTEYRTCWPTETRRHFGDLLEIQQQARSSVPHTPTEQLASEQAKAYDEWIDMRMIAEHTGVVGNLIYYPLFVLVLLLFARSTLFDNWDWPPGLVVTFVLSFIIVVACAVVLRTEAERARRIALTKVKRRLLVVTGGGPAYSGMAAQLQFMLQHMADMREGAFASFTHQPVVKALMIFLSASGLVFLEYFGVISV